MARKKARPSTRFGLTAKGMAATEHVVQEDVAARAFALTHPSRAPVTKDTNPKDRAASTRLALSLFPASARCYGALGLTEGDLKYGGFNWRAAGVRVSIYIDAISRHLEKWVNGEECDPVTKVPHLANAIAGLAVLIDGLEQGNVNDDRPPVQAVGALFDRCEEITKHLHTLFPPEKAPPRYRARAAR